MNLRCTLLLFRKKSRQAQDPARRDRGRRAARGAGGGARGGLRPEDGPAARDARDRAGQRSERDGGLHFLPRTAASSFCSTSRGCTSFGCTVVRVNSG